MTPQQERFLQKTRWLRPVTRWAAAFSINTSAWLPEYVRNAPLKLVKRILQGYQEGMNAGCKSS
jgi:hypothetical protein